MIPGIGAVFHYQYKNQQIIDVRPTGQQPLINLGRSKIDGGEVELVTRPVHSLTLHVGLGFLDRRMQLLQALPDIGLRTDAVRHLMRQDMR